MKDERAKLLEVYSLYFLRKCEPCGRRLRLPLIGGGLGVRRSAAAIPKLRFGVVL